jgi:trk system potassium uptake protein TrkH
MTLILIAMLLFGGLDLFESSVYAFGTAGTGGFAIKGDGLASTTPYVQWVIAIFMLLFGINFNLYFLIIIGKVAEVFKSTEFWVYIGIVLSAIAIVCFNVYDSIGDFSEAIRHSVFQVSSLMTTTGFSTTDFNLWPALAKTTLLILMFIGGSAGSTAGGFKVSRIVILFKKVVNDVKKVIHPRTANAVKFNGKKLGEDTINGVSSYLAIYVLIFAIVFFAISFDPNIARLATQEGVSAIETNLSATLACINNIGPGLGLVGPMANFACYTYFSKIILTFAMLFGRLEIYPVLLLFSVKTWMNK